jgi:hypothetical protein
MTVWKDKGSALAPAGACNNILDPNEQVYVSGVPIDSNTGGWLLGHVEGDKTVCLGVKWEIPTTVGNVIQTDSVTGDISFYTEQYRNNPNFTCPTSLPGGTTPAPAPVVDGVISAGEWNGCTDINFDSAKGTACVIAYPDYMYVKYQINDPTDDRSNENSVGNDQLGLNINPSGLPGSWGKPYDIVLQTGTDPAAFTTPVPDVAGSSGLTDGWESEWVTNATWGTLPVDVQTATPYYGATDLRISEWRLPLSSIAGLSSGSPLLVGGAVDIGDGNSYVYPVGLDWNVNATWATVTVK